MSIGISFYKTGRGLHWNIINRFLILHCTTSGLFLNNMFPSIAVAGLGLVEGVVCFCNGHLCNNGMKQASLNPTALALLITSTILHSLF